MNNRQQFKGDSINDYSRADGKRLVPVLRKGDILTRRGGILTEKGIMKNNMVDIDRLCIELKKSFSKTGTMTVNFPIVGDIRFSVDDIDTLKDYVISNK